MDGDLVSQIVWAGILWFLMAHLVSLSNKNVKNTVTVRFILSSLVGCAGAVYTAVVYWVGVTIDPVFGFIALGFALVVAERRMG